MTDKRDRKYPTAIPRDEEFVAMCVFRGLLHLATNKNLYVLVDDKLERVGLQHEEGPPGA